MRRGAVGFTDLRFLSGTGGLYQVDGTFRFRWGSQYPTEDITVSS